MKISTIPVCNKKRSCQGMTLVEVMLAAVIIAILAVVASNSLFYPRLLVVNSGLEQSAIHAATAELERNLYDVDSTPSGTFNTDGWAIEDSDITTTITTNDPPDMIPGTAGDEAEYRIIETVIGYRDGKTIKLVTYRAHKVSSTR